MPIWYARVKNYTEIMQLLARSIVSQYAVQATLKPSALHTLLDPEHAEAMDFGPAVSGDISDGENDNN